MTKEVSWIIPKVIGFDPGCGYKYRMNLIRIATSEDISPLYSLTSSENHIKEQQYFETCLEDQANKSREVLMIYDGEDLAGYCQYQRKPRYQPFRSMKIPEIQDIFIHPSYRQKGLATQLIEFCCQQAVNEGHDMIGIGVGLYSNYGKAQKLYFKMGFEPDGGGIVYDRQTVNFGQVCPVDDELCLMLIKKLN